MSAHEYDSRSPSASDDPSPASDTTRPATTETSAPALATGAELSVVTVTVSAALDSVPSLTMSWAT